MPLVQRYNSNSLQALYGNMEAHEMPIKLAVVGGVATPYLAGQILQETGTAGTYGKVVAGGTTPVLILKNDVEVSAAGLHYLGAAGASQMAATEAGMGRQDVPAYKTGEFDTRELLGPTSVALLNDAPSLAILARLGRLLQGTPDAGIVRLM
jgi:hypothetical protein